MAQTPNIFGVNLAQQINANLGNRLLPLTLIKITSERSSTDPTNNVETRIPHLGRGFTDSKTIRNDKGTLIATNNDVVSILGASLPAAVTPEPGDEITIEGRTRKISEGGVSRDPAGAVYECVVA